MAAWVAAKTEGRRAMTKTLDASLAAPARRVKSPKPGTSGRRSTIALVEESLRLLMWTVVTLFTLLLAVVIAVG
jgi:hypothetical protein